MIAFCWSAVTTPGLDTTLPLPSASGADGCGFGDRLAVSPATSRAKGARENTVLMYHALRNALVPVISVLGLDFGSYLTGSILTETVFSWPGIGRYVVNAIGRRDLPAIQGTVLFLSVVFVAVNLITDLAYAAADPRLPSR